MSDIKKGYTFTDKSTDWVSNKETAIRLNKMLDDAKVNLVAGTNISITPTANGPSIAATGAGTGTVTSVNLTAGTSISVSGGPITTSGSITVNNTAPDQVVSLTGAGTTTVTGTYPSFTISSADSATGTVTSVAATAGTGITVSGSPITTSGTLTITNSAPDQTVALTASTGITTSGTYPNFTIANSAPDQTVAIGAGTGISVSGTYPNFTVTNSSPSSGGTVTSVSGAGGSTGLTLTGGPITGSGTLALGGTLVIANGGTGTASPSLVAGSNVTISGSWPNQTINSVAGGTGTVTSVSVTTANGVSGTVTNSTTTPAISLSLGAITPTSVAASGAVSGSNLSGTNTGDQTNISGNAATVTTNANLTGPITSVGNATSVAAQTGTGSTFVMQASPTLTTPALGTPTSGLLNSCTSNINATGNVARTFQDRAGDVFNVKDFGAVGDGSANDTTAVQAAATAAVAKISSVGTTIPFGASLYFPAGTYRIAGTLSTIVIGSTIDSNQKSLTITGDGPGVSHIFQTTDNSGFVEIELANRSGRLNVFNLSVFNVATTQLSSSAAFKVSVTETGNNISHPNLDVRNVYVGGFADGSQKSFAYGFDLLNIRMGSFDSTMYIGNVTSGVGVRMRGVGATPSAPNDKTIDVAFNKCRFNFCQIGFEIKDSLEGILINNCTMAGVDYGIKADYCIHLGLSNSHINSRINAILSTGNGAGGAIDQGNIVNNSLYSEYANLEAVKGPFVRSVICGNQFLATNNNNGTVGVRLTTGSTGNNVSGNSFAWHRLSYVIVDSGATYNMVTGNMASRNTAAATTPFDNQGGGTNSFTNNVNEP